MAQLILLPTVAQLNVDFAGGIELERARGGVMWHYDDSSQDEWSVAWFKDPRCKYGYTRLYLDNGDVVSLSSAANKTPHAGVCITPYANSVFYGLSAATNGKVPVTEKQYHMMLQDTALLFKFHRWTVAEIPKRLRGHHEEATWNKSLTSDRSKWGKLGRKSDPRGTRADGKPIISMSKARADLALALR
jgi:hypothetical protein